MIAEFEIVDVTSLIPTVPAHTKFPKEFSFVGFYEV
jgi:hypothetical protein